MHAAWCGLTPEQALQQAPEEARKEIAAMEEGSRRTMAELCEVPARKQFDIEFARRIISHHNSGIIEFLEVQPRADHPAGFVRELWFWHTFRERS
ncbi:hypothetical protein [Streptomyces sp. NPDC059515]|uniref:hypothetical protein n=1 Tax=Streptomyces sp. NPDC059515 TaxID=3346854 RepID=UPI002C4F851C|nr:hypothetical protein [Nonomuraea sp.]